MEISKQAYSRSELMTQYGIDKATFRKWFKQFSYSDVNKYGKHRRCIAAKDVEAVLNNPEYLRERECERFLSDSILTSPFARIADERLASHRTIQALLKKKQHKTRYILHIGPTNSGKTYHAIQALHNAKCGAYFGPLRLLALETYDSLNSDGVICSLETGEERILIPFASVTASTVEMFDRTRHYDIAVIDEVQCISDPNRGSHWGAAIFQIDADEVHLCMAPEAEHLIQKVLEYSGASVEIRKYERLTPLAFCGVMHSLDEIQPGDALIAFSRKKVLTTAAELEARGIKTSVLYGNLPPMARREEVRRFTSGESQVMVATDAIGMGVSLPIRRVIFCEIEKYNGTSIRKLSASEVKQIAGRAGRYGKFEAGEVLTMTEPDFIQRQLSKTIVPIQKMTLPFPIQLVTDTRLLYLYLRKWNDEYAVPGKECQYEDMSRALVLLKKLQYPFTDYSIDILLRLITCPFNESDRRLMAYWHQCCEKFHNHQPIEKPNFDESSLEGCEAQYRAYELGYRLVASEEEKQEFEQCRNEVCDKVTALLLKDRASHLLRCKYCGGRLSSNESNGVCASCQLSTQNNMARITEQI